MTKHHEINEDEISRIVREVVQRIRAQQVELSIFPTSGRKQVVTVTRPPSGDEGIFQNIDDAIVAARAAHEELMTLSLEKRKEIIAEMRMAAIDNAELLAMMAVDETGIGRAQDKVAKNLLAARKTPGPEDLDPIAWTGDRGLTLVEPAPYGVCGSITPITNPSSTIINNSISIVSAGNAVVYNPHPAAKRVTNETVKILNRAIVAVGGPRSLLTSTVEPTLESSKAIMQHPKIDLLVVTGGGAVVKAGMTCGKKVIAAGPGNPPVIVDDTADIVRAAKDIVDGASFDNNLLCISEKVVFAFSDIATQLIEEMRKHGAFLLDKSQLQTITRVVFDDTTGSYPRINRKWVGKDVKLILKEIGVEAGDEIRLIIAETDSNHPLVMAEQLMPILPIVRVRNLDQALNGALKAEHGFRHTAMMHSLNVANMSRVAREIGTTIFIKNASSLAGLGFGGEGFTSFTIAGPTGEGITSARNFTRKRRCVLVDYFRII